MKNLFPASFSFEKDFLSKQVDTQLFYGLVQDKYFVDIGIPEDFEKAQNELSYPALDLNDVDASWTLFLDRDGVINVNKDDGYVLHTGEFRFLPETLSAIARLRSFFGRMIIVTNQRGIGKGLMDEQALADIHQHMIDHIEEAGGRIDALYYCAINDEKHHDRKPNPGMPLEASKMFPEIDFSKSIMVGDKLSDMEMGRNIGAFTVLITPNPGKDYLNHLDIDLRCESLAAFAERLMARTQN